MAVVMTQVLPEGVTLEHTKSVDAKLDAANNPPAGLIVHTKRFVDGRVHILDVWESEEQIHQFGERLGAAVGEMLAENGIQPAGEPETEVIPVDVVIRGT